MSAKRQSASGKDSIAGSSQSNNPSWKAFVVEGLHHVGAVRLTEKLARSFEFHRTSASSSRRLRRSIAPRLAVLCYHRVGVGGVPLYSELPAEMFEAQMRYLKKSYRIISLDQLIREISEPGSMEPAVTITFDDGYRGLYTEAFPILQKYGIPATIFLTVGCIDTGEVAWYDRIFLALKVARQHAIDLTLDRPKHFVLSSPAERMRAAVETISYLRTISPSRRQEVCAALESEIQIPQDELQDRMLTWDQIRAMHGAGVCFGGHTMTHPVVSRLSTTELEWEIVASTRIMEEKLDNSVRHFAFPFGKNDECGDPAISLLASQGYRSAATTEWGLNSVGSDPFRLRRVQIGETGSLAMFAFQLNRLFLSPEFESPADITYGGNPAIAQTVAEPQRVGR